MTAHSLPSERFPLATHFDVLRRFMVLSRNGTEAVAASAVESTGLPPGAVEENVAFLSEIGLLIEEAVGKFKPTPVAMQFINTAASDEQRGRKLLRSVVAKLWFGRTAAALPPEGGDTHYAELRSALTREAQLSTPKGDQGVAVLVEYLTYTGLVVPASLPATLKPTPDAPGGVPAESPTRPGTSDPSGERRVGPQGWKVLRTEDFDLSIRPDPRAVQRLRKHLRLLEEELEPNAPKKRGSP